jgi:ADP-ribose pyrophosphatase
MNETPVRLAGLQPESKFAIDSAGVKSVQDQPPQHQDRHCRDHTAVRYAIASTAPEQRRRPVESATIALLRDGAPRGLRPNKVIERPCAKGYFALGYRSCDLTNSASSVQKCHVMPSRVEIKGKRRLLDDFFNVEEAHLSFEKFDGTMSPVVRRLNFERGDSVAALLHLIGRDTAVLVNQFKYPSYEKGSGWITEVVAGMIDKGETPEDAIRREIHEETGYRADRVEHISTFYVSPGGSSERIMLYYAAVSGAEPTDKCGGLASESEDIKLIELPIADAFDLVRRGEIVDAKTIIALMWLEARHGARR